MQYQANLKELSQRPTPQWFSDAKFGIFIHWGLYSVPAFAPTEFGDISQTVGKHGYEFHLENNPYSEWYLNSLRVNGERYRKYHVNRFGSDFKYEDFAPIFNEEIKKWNPNQWASLFQEIGAKYVVITTKHHDGFTLWPSSIPNPRIQNYAATRNIIAELTQAVREKGLKMGLYYSGALDWSFSQEPIREATTLFSNPDPSEEYAQYADAHWHELIDKFRPEILWNDIAYPSKGKELEIIAHFFNSVPEGVVNDRWVKIPNIARKLHKSKILKKLVNKIAQKMATKGVIESRPPKGFANYTTPEYEPRAKMRSYKWEACRGIGRSFGYNQYETAEHYLTPEQLVWSFIDIVSKNGNLLLDIGPRADGSIPELQLERLHILGQWIKRNEEGIFGSRPYIFAESNTDDQLQVRFTQKDAFYAFILGVPSDKEVVIRNIHAPDNAILSILGMEEALVWYNSGSDLSVKIPSISPNWIAIAIKIENRRKNDE
jgi:alpha-L-fucosidase